MALEKLKIYVEGDEPLSFPRSSRIQVLFNPNQISISKTGWEMRQGSDGEPQPSQSPASLSVELFFDTTLPPGGNPLTSTSERLTDVREYTKRIYSLTLVNSKLNRPPLCQLVWGGTLNRIALQESVLFQGYLQQITKTLTHFTASGMPVRATLNCTFQEWDAPQTEEKRLNPIDDPIRVVRRGETLSSIAAEEYGDASQWRLIANANRLEHPRALRAGQVLTVPPLRS